MLKIAIISASIILTATLGWGVADPFEPWGSADQTASKESSSPATKAEGLSLPARIALGGLNFFSEYISKVDGDRCPMYPTCAAYSRQAIKKHGFFTGVVMTADRLIHENSEMQYAPLVKVGGAVRYSDPVSENDFWWYGKECLDK